MLRALGAFTFFAALHLALAAFHGETLLVFILLQALTMASFGLISANLGAIAMEPLGHIAGTASSVQGMITTRSEEHTSELQSLMRISYAVFCLKKQTQKRVQITN